MLTCKRVTFCQNDGVDIADAVAVHVPSAASTSASGPMEMVIMARIFDF